MGKPAISVCFGSMNEEKAIRKVILEIRRHLGSDVAIIITDSSTDRTYAIAAGMGAKVIWQPPLGYGIALRTALSHATGEIVVTTDCDGTYPMETARKMVRMIRDGNADVVSGSRLKGKKIIGAMTPLNKLGNTVFAVLVRLLYGFECTDPTTGFRAYRADIIKSINWTENTGLSLELMFKPAALGYRVVEIPIEYRARIGKTKLNPLLGGAAMLKTIIKYKLIPITKGSK